MRSGLHYAWVLVSLALFIIWVEASTLIAILYTVNVLLAMAVVAISSRSS